MIIPEKFLSNQPHRTEMALRAWRTIYDARRFSMAFGMNCASATKHFDRREADGSMARRSGVVQTPASALEKSRLRRFFQTTASSPPAKGVTFAGCLAPAFSTRAPKSGLTLRHRD